jgi:hypothetical protein
MELLEKLHVAHPASYNRPTRTTASATRGRYEPRRQDYVDTFYAVLARWERETLLLSDPTQIQAHPSFSALAGLAKQTTPLIIQELRKGPSLLTWVLESGLGFRPYPESLSGNIQAITEAWIIWYEREGRESQR